MSKDLNYEDKACEFLQAKGWRIITRNFRSRWGEIDIIAQDKDFTVFVEVKGRTAGALVLGLESVDWHKRKRIRKTAQFYAAAKPDSNYRFDVLEIIENNNVYQYNLISAAFDMQEF